MSRAALPLACLFLTACGGALPPVDTTISPAAQAQAFPRLQPIDTLLAEAARPARAEAAGAALAGRGAALSRAGIASPSGGSLADRGARLRARAEQLRSVDI